MSRPIAYLHHLFIAPNEVIAATQKAIQSRQPLYEAAFAFHGGYARADILVPVTYNASFETGRPKECCELLPEFKPWLRKVTPRIVDLLLPFRGFRYYHPQQHGSASMKAVLPALTGQGYDHLAIQEAGDASREFLHVTYGQATAAERHRVRQDLEEYCGQDTLGMLQIVAKLKRLRKR